MSRLRNVRDGGISQPVKDSPEVVLEQCPLKRMGDEFFATFIQKLVQEAKNLMVTWFREQIGAVLPQEWIEVILAMRLAVTRRSHVKRGIQAVPQVFRIGVINGYFEWVR